MRWLAAAIAGSLVLCGAAVAQQRGAQPLVRPAPSPVPAPTPTTQFNVGIVDISGILRQSTAALALQRQLQVEQEKYQQQTEQRQRLLQDEEDALERQRSSLTPEAYAQKRREFQERLGQITADFRVRRRQIDEAFNRASSDINRLLQAVIEELARSQNIQLVIRREAVLYQQTVFDLTEEAGRILNERLPSVEINLPPQP